MVWLWHGQREKMRMLKNVRSGFRNNPYKKQVISCFFVLLGGIIWLWLECYEF